MPDAYKLKSKKTGTIYEVRDSRVDTLEEQTLNTRVTTLEGEMDAVEGRATSLEGRATALENGKIPYPASTVTEGKILTANGEGGAVWEDGVPAEDIAALVAAWMEQHIVGGDTLAIDNTLSLADYAADAKKTGELVAPVYSNAATYAVGDYVNYNGALYRCISAITTAESWTAAHWSAVKLAPEIADLKRANKNNVQANYVNESDLFDYAPLDNTAWMPMTGNTYIYVSKEIADVESPFFPRPITKLKALDTWTAAYRGVGVSIPNEVIGNDYAIGIWVNWTLLSASKQFRIYLSDSDNNFTALYAKSSIGIVETKGNATLVCDAIVDNWEHLTVYNKDSLNSTKTSRFNIFMWVATVNDYFKISSPTFVITDNYIWSAVYRNPYYNNNTLDLSDVLFNKKIGWFGDSIMLGQHQDEYYGWYEILKRMGAIIDNKAINGAMVAVAGAGYHSIISETGIGEFAADTDYLIFDGGANDFFNRITLGTISADYTANNLDTETYLGAMEQVCYNLLTNYPTSKIGYIIPYKMQGYQDIEGQKAYFDGAIEVCKKWGIPYLDLRYMCGLNYGIASMQQYFKDNVHIGKNGYQFTENIIAEWIRSI